VSDRTGKTVRVEVVRGSTGVSLVFDNHRMSNGKLYGVGKVLHVWDIPLSEFARFNLAIAPDLLNDLTRALPNSVQHQLVRINAEAHRCLRQPDSWSDRKKCNSCSRPGDEVDDELAQCLAWDCAALVAKWKEGS